MLRSGIGKTQLFKILAGLNQPTTGIVKIGADKHKVREGEVGVVSQNYILFNHRSIRSNLAIALERNSAYKTDTERKDIITHYAEQFNLKEHLDKYPMQLSGGQRQRVSILQQALTGNQFILLDELSTLIVVSHDIENSLAISDTVFVMANQPGKQGATITEKLDLIDMGFAWNTGIREDHKFQDLVKQMKYKI
jgi:ABC-type nitrate/sulfonate/bicarbonate transport system ATPase subunit